MIGDGYWSSGITVTYQESSRGWLASATFYDDGFGRSDADTGEISTTGVLTSRYFVPDGRERDGLTAAIDTVKTDAERLGITWRDPALFVPGDGDGPQQPLPAGWRSLLDEHAARLGWENPLLARRRVTRPGEAHRHPRQRWHAATRGPQAATTK
jgi:hypothetical protein